MLHWVSAALLLAVVVILVRWMHAGVDALGRTRSYPWFPTVCLVALGFACLIPGLLRARLEHRLSAAAETIVGVPVEVRCQAFGGAFVDAGADLGYVAFGPDGVPERATLIQRTQCRDLSAFLRSSKVSPTHEQVVAVHVLTHEAMHMRGLKSEAETECLAVQHDAAMAQLLGAPPEAARDLAVAYWQNDYPRMPAGYRSEECGPGKLLDARLSDAPWSVTE